MRRGDQPSGRRARPAGAPGGPMTGNPGGPMNLAENRSARSHAHGRRHAASSRPHKMPDANIHRVAWHFDGSVNSVLAVLMLSACSLRDAVTESAPKLRLESYE